MKRLSLPIVRCLRRDQFLRFEHPRGLCLRAERGALWATIDGDPGDIVIEPGSAHIFNGDDAVLVGSVRGEAVLTASAPRGAGRWRDWAGLAGPRVQVAA